MILYTQKKEGFDFLAQHLCVELQDILNLPHLKKITLINAYLLQGAVDVKHAQAILYEPQTEVLLEVLDLTDCDAHFAIQTLKGQFDPRSHAAMQCLQMLDPNTPPPLVEHANIYKLYGKLNQEEVGRVLSYLTNPLENHAISLPLKSSQTHFDPPLALDLWDFAQIKDFKSLITKHQLSLSPEDLKLIQTQLPHLNLLELKILDTYWSDHCRHSTFLTEIQADIKDPLAQEIFAQYLQMRQELNHHKPITLMDLSTLMVKWLKKHHKLPSLVQSEENNACTLAIEVKTKEGNKPYFLFFKNETHNHPTEIEPFGGASTCIGGAIRDPLSARGFVYAGLRISGCANPLEPIQETKKGKLPQRKIATSATHGFSSYGNQIGIATGIVSEVYHEGYKAKHLELGAVLGIAAREHVKSLVPQVGDLIVLIGGRTGRDGCGGASGSSLSHDSQSLELCGAQVQKGNATEERKLQRLIHNPNFSKLIKRCNDLGAGGVSVAIPEMATSGVEIYLDRMPTKYTGLTPFDLALSESQERMAMLIDSKDLEAFQTLCESENVLSVPIATITQSQKLEMFFHDRLVASIPVALLQSNGAPRTAKACISTPPTPSKICYDFLPSLKALASDLNTCSQRGLIETFDSTIGSNTIFMPLGGKYQTTPIQTMAHLIPFEETSTCSLLAFGFDPYTCELDTTKGGYLAVIEAVCKLVACGVKFEEIYLSFQEYFESLGADVYKWGKPLGVLLGAFLAQKRLGIACIGGKDSMSGSFENLNVPPSFVCFAFCAQEATHLISPELKAPGHFLYLIQPPLDSYGLPDQLESLFAYLHSLITQKIVLSAYALARKGVAEALLKMSSGNMIGVELEENISLELLFAPNYGGFVLESTQELDQGIKLGQTSARPWIQRGMQSLELTSLLNMSEHLLESLYPTKADAPKNCPLPSAKTQYKIARACPKIAKPRVLVPVFPGTNCEHDTQRAFEQVGAQVQTLIVSNLTPKHLAHSITRMQQALNKTQILFLPGGFSGGDEPDGAGKMIKAFFSNPYLRESIARLLDQQDGLIGGICNGFQALLKLGLLPFGSITPVQPNHPTLLHNSLLRHQSKIAYTQVVSNRSPWLSCTQQGEIYAVPISHGEGRFFAPLEMLEQLAQNDQIATRYVNSEGAPSLEIEGNPNGSLCGIEGITSPCGRVFGKMGHSERFKPLLYRNVPGNFHMEVFKGGVKYYS
ncbi:phosphoribosylformylglycinamidine synthase [Helicobacter baculiformis]|uniref:Phosphoribosylformylglycinamidine synthase n=1 Tax=Helicobacter baculiformis TaxID=427351 RepID=A0ABV7ZJA2_9HELI|nr:phosphoribosylformylglycinamidine synthase [Helicobacter baculiformis]